MRPLDPGLESLGGVELERAGVAGLDRELDLGVAGGPEIAHAPPDELTSETTSAPFGQQTDDADLAALAATVARQDERSADADEPLRFRRRRHDQDAGGVEVGPGVDLADERLWPRQRRGVVLEDPVQERDVRRVVEPGPDRPDARRPAANVGAGTSRSGGRTNCHMLER